jgi:hypothetical protein
MAAGLNFLPTVCIKKNIHQQKMIETYATAANGGRIGFCWRRWFLDQKDGVELKEPKRVWNSMSDDIQNKYNGV